MLIFDNGHSMVTFLNEHFKTDDLKDHYLINDEMLAIRRKNTRGECGVSGSRKLHLIAVNADGEWFNMEHYQDQDYVLNLSFFEENVGNTEDKRSEVSVILGNDIDDDEDECTNEESDFRDRSNYLFEVITPGTFVVMRCPENSIELFFVGEVLTKV